MLRELAGAAILLAGSTAAAQTLTRPKLVVVISVDQFSADLFDEYRPHFTGGLKRLAGGTAFRNGFQGQAATETCPGHSTLLTGSLPARTGIIANQWVDQSITRADKHVYCAEDESAPDSTSSHYKVSSMHLRVPTIGDLLKQRSPASLNVAVAGKDRAAVMMSGHDADQRWYWSGRDFVTDLAGKPVPGSIVATNQAVDRLVAQPEPGLEPPTFCQSKAAPVALPGGKVVGNGRFQRAAGDYAGFENSPAMDGATLALALHLVQELKLGADNAPDILSVGLSATDHVGHAHGPEGQEQCLNLLSLDRELGQFLQVLDAWKLDYAVVLTADHGIQPIPERNHGAHPEAARADPALSAGTVGKSIGQKLGLSGPVLIGGLGGNIYLDAGLSEADRAKAEAEAIRFYSAHRQVQAVFTKEQLALLPLPTGNPQAWTLEQRARASFDPERSGDLVVLLKQWITPIPVPEDSVATHGSPWDYDRRVPILFWRRGMASADRADAIDTVDIMPTLAAIIGLPIDASKVDGRCLKIGLVACPQ